MPKKIFHFPPEHLDEIETLLEDAQSRYQRAISLADLAYRQDSHAIWRRVREILPDVHYHSQWDLIISEVTGELMVLEKESLSSYAQTIKDLSNTVNNQIQLMETESLNAPQE